MINQYYPHSPVQQPSIPPLKVVFFSHYADLLGANRSLLYFLSGIEGLDLKPLVVVPQQGDFTIQLKAIGVQYIVEDYCWWMLEERGIPKIRFNVIKYIKKLSSFKKKISKIRQHNRRKAFIIAKRLSNFNPDIIYSNSSVINVGFLVARILKIPHVWHFREFAKDDYNLVFINRLKDVRRQFYQSDKLIGVSIAICEHWKNFVGKAPCLVYNGVTKAEEIYNKNAHFRKPIKGELKFGILGLLRVNKGQEEAIRAFAEVVKKFPNAELIIGGEGPDKRKLERMVNHLQIPNIVFAGYIDDPFEFFNRVDVGLVCSPKEGLGKVTIEAMSTGTPIIGFDNAGTSEIIRHEKNGLLYSNTQDLIHYMMKLSTNPHLISEYGDAAKKTVVEQFTIERYVQSIYRHLQQLSKHGSEKL